MGIKVAINGFGRIGRLVFRALHEQGLLQMPPDRVEPKVTEETVERWCELSERLLDETTGLHRSGELLDMDTVRTEIARCAVGLGLTRDEVLASVPAGATSFEATSPTGHSPTPSVAWCGR